MIVTFKDNKPPVAESRAMQRITGAYLRITESKAIQCIKGNWYLFSDADGKKPVIVGKVCVKPNRSPLFLDTEEAKNFATEVKGMLVFAGSDIYATNKGVFVVKLFDARSVFEKYGPDFVVNPDSVKIIKSK